MKVGRDVITCEEFLKPKKRNVMGELVYPVRVCLIENIIIPKWLNLPIPGTKNMGRTIVFGGALVSLVETDFQCPECKEKYGEDFYYKALQKSKYGIIYRTCKRCGIKMGISSDMRGDVIVWDKTTEWKK